MTITTPKMGNLGNTPTLFHTNMPRWASLLLAAACIAIGLWASAVTLQFFEHGAAALESDPALQALAKAAAYLFVFAEMSAFILAALIIGRELSARRWSLYIYAGVVLIVEVFTISAIQIATVVGADMTQASASESMIDLRKQIAAAEAQAATYMANAASLRANDQLKKATTQTDKATAAQDKAAALYAQLGTVRDAKRPTLSAMLGEKLAIGYAVVRGLLVPATGLIFFGVAGALMMRHAGVSLEERILIALNHVEPVATMQAAPAVSFKPASNGYAYSSKTALAGAGLLATVAPTVMAAPAANAAGVTATVTAGVPEQGHLAGDVGVPEQGHPVDAAGVPEQGHLAGDVGVPEQGHPVDAAGVPEQGHLAGDVGVPEQGQAKRKKTAVPDGSKIDSGTTGKSAGRYRRVKVGVLTGTIKPSVRGIQLKEGGGTEVVTRYLQALEKDGVIVRAGRGYALANKGGAA